MPWLNFKTSPGQNRIFKHILRYGSFCALKRHFFQKTLNVIQWSLKNILASLILRILSTFRAKYFFPGSLGKCTQHTQRTLLMFLKSDIFLGESMCFFKKTLFFSLISYSANVSENTIKPSKKKTFFYFDGCRQSISPLSFVGIGEYLEC